ncbi:MAG: 2-oxo acid dehydrogenase subunit E2 [Verrucomicrobiota bacterium]
MAETPPTLSPSEAAASVRLRDWPVYRNNISDFLHNAQRRKNISTWWEVDITEVSDRVQRIQRETRIAISLNAYWIYHLAQAVRKHPEMQAVRVPLRRKLAQFDGVDVGTVVEQRVPGLGSIVLPYTIRNADKKSLATICAELRGARKLNLLANDPAIRLRGRLAHFPRLLRLLFWKWVDFKPDRRRRIRGTVGVTNLSYLADDRRPAFGVPLVLQPTNLAVGSIYKRLVPCEKDPRGFRVATMLCLTLTVDHDVVDGAPMVRFARTFTYAVERAEGLDQAFTQELSQLFGKEPADTDTAAS